MSSVIQSIRSYFSDEESFRRGTLVLGVLGSLAALGISLIGRVDGNGSNLANHLLYNGWVLVWLVGASILFRSLGLLDLARFWFLGYFIVSFVVVVLGSISEFVLDDQGTVHLAVAIPIIEESLKATPVVLFALWLRPRLTQLSLTDMVIAGFATGAGFSFREDLIRQRLAADGFDGSFWGTLFPSTLHEGSRFIVVHGGWTAIASFGLGLMVLHRKPWAIGVAVIGWLVAVLDHAAVNSYAAVGEGIHAVMLDGRLAAFTLVGVIVAACVHDAALLRHVGRSDDRFESTLGPASASIGGWIRSVRYRRLLVGARLHAWRTNRWQEPEDLVDHAPIVNHLGRLEDSLQD